MEQIAFFIPGPEDIYEQQASYAFIKALVEEFTQEEVYLKRIFRLTLRLDGQLAVAQVGQLCPVYQKPIYAIFETSCTYVVVSKSYFYCPVGVRKDEVFEVETFREEAVFQYAS